MTQAGGAISAEIKETGGQTEDSTKESSRTQKDEMEKFILFLREKRTSD